jgi:hypothetical protein
MNRRLRKRSANGRNDKKSIMRIQCTPNGWSDAVLASSLPPGGTESVATKPSAWPQVVVWRQHTLTCPDLRMPQAEFDAFDQLARRRGVKRSTLARQVLEDYLAEHLDELP